MHHAVLFLLLLAVCPLARAQETEARIQKILNPDKNSASNLQGKAYYGGKSFQDAGTAPVMKSFYISQRYSAKAYSPMAYSNVSSFWAGNTKFGTAKANTKGLYEIPNAGKKADTKTMEVKTASDSGKSYAANTYETQPFRGTGKSQKILDQQNADRKAMSIDEVRDLLNKNK